MNETPQSLAPKLVTAFPAGSVLFREGDVGGEMFVIQAGRVRVYRTIGGIERVLAVLGPGEFVGEMAVLINDPRSATAVVEEDARLIVVDAEMLEALIRKNTEVAVRLLKRLAHRLKVVNDQVAVLLHRDARVRVVMALAKSAADTGTVGEDGTRVACDPEQLALRVGLDLERVQEVFGMLERGGTVVRVSGESFLIRDMARFREYAEFLVMRESEGELGG
jgi:CRP-like cAMP-binding protein